MSPGSTSSVGSGHLEANVLSDYWLSALSSSEEEAVEEHLLGCGECCGRLEAVIALAEGVRRLAREGSLRMIVSDTFLQRAAEEGLRIRQYSPPRGGSVECTVKAHDDLLIARLAADLSGAKRIDLCLCGENGVEQLRMRDIPVDSRASSIVYQESITFGKALPTSIMIARLVSVDEVGAQRPLGEYTFNHTRSIPA